VEVIERVVYESVCVITGLHAKKAGGCGSKDVVLISELITIIKSM